MSEDTCERAGRQQRPRGPPALLLSCCDTQEHACIELSVWLSRVVGW